jgi:hypothetical protein
MAASPPARWRSGRSTPYRPGLEPPGSHDACFLPRCTPVTGDVQIHEMAYVGDELCFINTTRLSSKPRARSRDPAVNVYILRSVYYSTSAARLRYPTNRLGECPFAAGLDQLANGFPWELCCTASHLPLFLRASVRRHRSKLTSKLIRSIQPTCASGTTPLTCRGRCKFLMTGETVVRHRSGAATG